ncbi:MAG TPA: hypothetical protein VLC95_05715, partial [Anaerolineae bacterium]|nr:hypothetical protein [Anaerolineae bacterium]
IKPGIGRLSSSPVSLQPGRRADRANRAAGGPVDGYTSRLIVPDGGFSTGVTRSSQPSAGAVPRRIVAFYGLSW